MADGGHVCRRAGILFGTILAQLDTEGNILTKFNKNPTSGLGGDAITRNVYRRTVRRTDAGELPDLKKSSCGLRLQELKISKRALKKARRFK